MEDMIVQNEDTIFTGFVLLCLAGPFVLMGLGFLLNIRYVMGIAGFVLSLLSIFASPAPSEESGFQLPQKPAQRIITGVVLLLIGGGIALFFLSNAG